jgi:hypothetical protein
MPKTDHHVLDVSLAVTAPGVVRRLRPAKLLFFRPVVNEVPSRDRTQKTVE